jgi:lipopolysaccharide biosynthesis glycosyltransferase
MNSPTPTQKPILHIVSNSDERFLPGLEVAVASAVASASGKYDYQFHVIDGGLPMKSLERLSHKIATISSRCGIHAELKPLIIDQNRLKVLPERRGSRMTYAKLVLPEVLPHLESIIYLDADVLCFSGIESVRPPDGEERRWLLAGARDFFGVIEKDCPWLEQVPQAEHRLPYINCGVMWLNLRELRAMNFTERAIAARAAAGKARQGDQSVFNFLCRGKSFILPAQLNHVTSIGSARLLCEGNIDLNLHFIGSPKPWLGPPKTSNWLAHRLWHKARSALFSEVADHIPPPPADAASIRRKALFYAIFNPSRSSHYRSDLHSLTDPGNVVAKARSNWPPVLHDAPRNMAE